MPLAETDKNRIAALFQAIENRKAHAYAAPTYKDSPDLNEMTAIVLRQKDTDAQTLEDTVPTLSYLTECYDKMGRAGMSAPLYALQLAGHVRLMSCRPYDEENRERLKTCFYKAVKARNAYGPDDCADLAALVKEWLPEKVMREELRAAQRACRTSPKHDPVEKTPAYLAVIDDVEARIDREKPMDLCLAYWHLKARFLLERGILWRSPAELNPHVLFD